jgi:hypothetical protein
MKSKAIGLVVALGIFSTGVVSMSVANAQPSQSLTRAQVKAELNKAFLNGTLPEDEGNTYPTPAFDRSELAAHHHYEEAHGRY